MLRGDSTIYVMKTMMLISCAVTMKHAKSMQKSRVSHDTAQSVHLLKLQIILRSVKVHVAECPLFFGKSCSLG